MTTKKIPFDSIYYDPNFNNREVDQDFVLQLAESMAHKDEDGNVCGLLEPFHVAQVSIPDKSGEETVKYKVITGAHRYHALLHLKNTDADVFEKIAPGGKIALELVEGDIESLKDRNTLTNTKRKGYTPWETYAEVVRRHVLGQDTYEIAYHLNIQQPRVSEFLSFQKLSPEIHAEWKKGTLSHHDLTDFAALGPDEQAQALTEFLSGVQASGGKKSKARKELGKKAKGGKREYANAGKPSRKTLDEQKKCAFVDAHETKTVADRAFWNAIAAAYKVVNGELSFDKLVPGKDYVTKKEAAEAAQAVAAAAEKAAKKAERAKAAKTKAEKAPKAPKAEKAPKAPKPKKAEKAPKAEKPKKAPKPKKAEKAEKAPKAAKPTKAKKTKGTDAKKAA